MHDGSNGSVNTIDLEITLPEAVEENTENHAVKAIVHNTEILLVEDKEDEVTLNDIC